MLREEYLVQLYLKRSCICKNKEHRTAVYLNRDAF